MVDSSRYRYDYETGEVYYLTGLDLLRNEAIVKRGEIEKKIPLFRLRLVPEDLWKDILVTPLPTNMQKFMVKLKEEMKIKVKKN